MGKWGKKSESENKTVAV